MSYTKTNPEQVPAADRVRSRLRRFFFPELNRWLLIRAAVVAVTAYLFFGRFCIPM